MKRQVPIPDLKTGRTRMPDIQGFIRTMLSSDYIEHNDRNEGEKFPELTSASQCLSSRRLSLVEFSSKSCHSNRVEKKTSHVGDSMMNPFVSVQTGRLNSRKCREVQNLKIHIEEEMVKSESFKCESNLNIKEHSKREQISFLRQHSRETVQKHPQSTQMTKSDSSNSILRRENHEENSAIKGYACDQCGRCFKVKQQLTRHQGFHPKIKSCECKFCSKVFSSNWKLERHMLVHNGKKPFDCQVCKKTFSLRYNLENHIRIHSGEKPFTCEICYKGFSILGSLCRHRRIHTGEKPYMCEVCMKRFSDTSNLETHSRVHTGEKPYECEICKKTFSVKGNLTCHKRVHLGEQELFASFDFTTT